MATYEKKLLSQSYLGTGIPLDSTGSPVNIHTSGSSATIIDEVWLYVANAGNTAATFTLEMAGVGITSVLDIPAYSNLILVAPGLPITGTGTAGSTVTGTDNDSTGNLYVSGYVNRITP
jgi:hypothetical protein